MLFFFPSDIVSDLLPAPFVCIVHCLFGLFMNTRTHAHTLRTKLHTNVHTTTHHRRDIAHTHAHTVYIANSGDWSPAAADIDALITVEVLFVAPDPLTGEQLQIANIQFNNLDIIGEICLLFFNFASDSIR